MNLDSKRLILLASGGGTNAENIIQYFSKDQRVEVAAVLTNNPNAGVCTRVKAYGIEVGVMSQEQWKDGSRMVDLLSSFSPDLIILAGYLKRIPAEVIVAYPNKIVNIHPSLLPKYGGKGMYGMHVHEAVFKNAEKETGITIHFVNEHYDEGQVIIQKSTSLQPSDHPETIAAKVHDLEMHWFPMVIEALLLSV